MSVLHLAQAFSNRAPRGRKHDFKDAERLVRRLIAQELILSFVPDGEQRTWRNLTRMKLQLVRDRVRLQSQIECLLEEMRIELSVVVTDLLGLSGLRILHALANGETDAKNLASLGDHRLKCSEEQLIEALTGSSHPLHRQMLALQLERLRLIDAGQRWLGGSGGSMRAAMSRRARQRSSAALRRRLAKSPKWRMRTRPLGRTCNRKRRRNSWAETVMILFLPP